MRKIALLGLMAGLLGLSLPSEISFAKSHTKKQVVHVKKAKKKAKKKVVYKRPRYATNINKPQEGDLLKLEGMVKDLNEQ
ncbi:MAG: hypothetical protein ACK4LT_06170 [Aquificaceae bacterium]